jgi:hypothetical protein
MQGFIMQANLVEVDSKFPELESVKRVPPMSPMREYRTSGSARGAPGKRHPYRDPTRMMRLNNYTAGLDTQKRDESKFFYYFFNREHRRPQ